MKTLIPLNRKDEEGMKVRTNFNLSCICFICWHRIERKGLRVIQKEENEWRQSRHLAYGKNSVQIETRVTSPLLILLIPFTYSLIAKQMNESFLTLTCTIYIFIYTLRLNRWLLRNVRLETSFITCCVCLYMYLLLLLFFESWSNNVERRVKSSSLVEK